MPVNAKDREAKKAATKALFARDFPTYSEKCLRIRPKAGGAAVPFVLNRVQKEIHQRLENQIARAGMVRALILKCRQPGCSTYVEGRYFWKVTHNKGRRAFILTHKQDATDNLFGMAVRFLENLPDEMRPHVGTESAKELEFDLMDSGYSVSTAGSKGAGRSHTIQYFHGSEVAFWENADEHMTGALQAVPPLTGTEIILESTANGIGGLFYSMCKAAERGEGVFEVIFIPWQYHDEYSATPPDGWKPPADFETYGQLHNLTPAQVYWAYKKNSEFAIAQHEPTDVICQKFRQEYPATAEEAFNTGTSRSFISPNLVIKARKFVVPARELSYNPIIFGVDVARGGRARTKLIDRQGRKAGGWVNESYNSNDAIEIGDWIARKIEEFSPEIVNIDATGVGGPVYDYLRSRGYARGDNWHRLNAIYLGNKASDEVRYANKRAEIYDELLGWLADPLGVQIPDDNNLHVELCAPIWGPGATRYEKDRLLIEAKEHIWERLKVTCDDSDALALTFATRIFKQSREDKIKMERYYRESAKSII